METLTREFTDSDAPEENILTGENLSARAECSASGTITTAARPEFHIVDESSANWFLRKLAGIESEKARVRAQAAQIVAELDADAQRLRNLYEAEAREWAREELEKKGNRRKSLTLLQGTLAFRSVPAGLRVDDAAAALNHAATIGAVKVDEAAYREAAIEAQKTTGELLPGVVVVPERESFAIRFGKGDSSAEI